MELSDYRLLTKITLKMCALLSSWADAIIVNSDKGKRDHSSLGYKPEKMVTIPNGFDTALFRPDPEAKARLLSELGLGKKGVLIGQIARFDPMKDHASFLQAASLLNSNEKVHFVLAGKEVVWGNRELARNLNPKMTGRVHFLGPREDVHRIVPALDIAVSSSAYGEGFSNSIGEAMACGVPCVVTNVGDSARIVGDTGIVVPPRDPAALACAWARLLEMGEAERKRLGMRARVRMHENYRIEKVVGQFEEFYEGIIGVSPGKWPREHTDEHS
jgi:glycosyltransferase involved in cell wall biosynthesis